MSPSPISWLWAPLPSPISRTRASLGPLDSMRWVTAADVSTTIRVNDGYDLTRTSSRPPVASARCTSVRRGSRSAEAAPPSPPRRAGARSGRRSGIWRSSGANSNNGTRRGKALCGLARGRTAGLVRGGPGLSRAHHGESDEADCDPDGLAQPLEEAERDRGAGRQAQGRERRPLSPLQHSEGRLHRGGGALDRAG